MKSPAHAVRLLTLAGCLAAAGSAQAGVLDFLFGSSKAEPAQPRQADTRRKSWRIGEFTEMHLAASESGAPANAQPVTLSSAQLRELLGPVKVPGGNGNETLFGREELDELVDSMSEAFQVAGPRDDVLLVSSSRRGGGILTSPTSVTARLFVQGGNLNLIVHDTRFDYFGPYRGSGKLPEFVYGSRSGATSASIERAGATRRRGDWLEIPVAATVAAPAPGMAAPAAPGAAAAAAVAAPAPAPSQKPRDAAFFEEQEQRLAALKRLREKGLITEEEYQQKRAEILKSL